MQKPLLLAARGGGSTIVEAQFILCGLDYEVDYLEWQQLAEPGSRLAKYNPLREIPTLVLADGQVLSESAAITLWLGDFNALLVPQAAESQRVPFLRRLIWLVSALYPTFTFGDHPERFVGAAESDALRRSTDGRRQQLWLQWEKEVRPEPYLLGNRLTALDIYLCVMCCWRPRPAWFASHCPKLFTVAKRISAIPELQALWKRNELNWKIKAANS